MCAGTLFRIFLGLLYLCANLAGTDATSLFLFDPPKAVVRYGSPVSVTCSTNVTNMGLSWEISEGKCTLLDEKKVTWTLESVTEWTMKPYCFMNINEYIQEKLEFDITIYKTPDSVSIRTEPMTEGRQYELQCDIQNVAPVKFLTVKWYKGQTLVKNTPFNDSTKTPVNLTATLQISPSRHDNGTEYWCEAVLDLGPDGPQPPPTNTSDPLNIIVHYGPEISCPSHVKVKKGDVFQPNCMAEGYPAPEMTWTMDGEDVNFPKIMELADDGEYILIAKNSATASHKLEVEVLYAPLSISELQGKLVDYGYDVELKCSSKAKPHPQYRWTHHQAPNVRTQDMDGVSLLFIDYAVESNIGTYTCIAYNELGEKSQSVTVEVRGASDNVFISTVNHTGPVIENISYKLQCDVHYVAPVDSITVMWYKGETVVHTSSTGFSETLSEAIWSTTFPVSHNRRDNGTQYTCEAKLKKGQMEISLGESAPLKIMVHYKPVINSTKLPSVVPVFRGYPEVLICEAEGYPKPKITWTMKPYTKAEQGNLTIMEATNENVGLYNCTASNAVESTVRVVKVIMKEDYLPLIAGFVALVVVIISVIFVVIYSIYYKNTKMGRYTFDGAKPNAQNGHVAQNGKDNPIPMKTLSQNIARV